ncbi:hypothetical protein I3843_04G103600 [Carya illinoinensis]|nr:hypothetical protein I3843_04G103600 [Carya illinoinensis]
MMDMQSTRKFLAELNVLTHGHHLNLVQLIGYCVEGSLFLVYEYIENGNLSQHLRGSLGEIPCAWEGPIAWSTRVQISLDLARALEHIHEYTIPVYIHCDIKSASILIDKNFHGKVANFGLSRLTKGKTSLLPTHLVGTFGYLAPEYAHCRDFSFKVDIYAFGVVLYELIFVKPTMFKSNSFTVEHKSLVTLVFMLARECTLENPQLRPSMRAIVIALMILSSTFDV